MEQEKRKVSTKFAGVLAIISMIGFANIISESFFTYSISTYFDSIWLFLVGIGFLMAAKPRKLYENSQKQFSDASFARLTTLIIGLIAITAATLTLPEINIVHPALETVKAIISIIAIVFIFFQTWILDH